MSSPSPVRRNPFVRPILRALASLIAWGALAGCAKSTAPTAEGFDASSASLLDRMGDALTLADLRVPGGRLISSTDITGGNNDSTASPGKDGWITLADLTGPGYVSRIWMAGWADYGRKLRFFFDGEAEPRIALGVNEFFGNTFPFLPPFALQENFCVYSLLPIPFAKSLRVQIASGAANSRLYFQINHTPLPPASKVTSHPAVWTDADKEAWNRAAAVLRAGSPALPQGMVSERRSVQLAPGATVALDPPKGPGILREVRCTPVLDGPGADARAQAMLRQANLQIRWNGESFASLELPLGDFFGQSTRLTAYSSLAHSFDGTTLSCRLPMPFKEASFVLVNTGDQTFTLDFEFRIQPVEKLPAHLGYLHAGWQGSWPEDIGPPHAALRILGDGKYVGGMLSVDSAATGSWWGLEGDEILRMDDAFMPQWKGTGIEDHYNGGWYYRVTGAEMLTGLLLRVPYQAVQYRWLELDAPRFARSFDLHFERGGENEAPLLMESSAWYYLSAPREADTDIPPFSANSSRSPARTEKDLCAHLAELERFRDLTGCRRMIRAFLAESARPGPTAERLRLRDLLYRERQEGVAAVAPLLAESRKTLVLPSSTNTLDHLAWLRADPARALLQVASPTPVDVWYAGQKLATTAQPVTVFRVHAPSAPVTVALRSSEDKSSAYLHANLVTQDREWRSDDTWRYQEQPADGWQDAGYDDAAWKRHYSHGHRVAIPPETADFPLDLFSRAENIIRPPSDPSKAMVHRVVWRPADGQPLLGP